MNVIAWIARKILHFKTRSIEPRVGQRWAQDDACLIVTKVYENGDLGISTQPTYSGGWRSSISWRESRENWATRVRSRSLFLWSDPSLKEQP